jgi:long-chain acyl-CoA synthetase
LVKKLNPVIRGEDKDQKFIGIWSKNRAEWTITLLSTMRIKTSAVGFYDSMGEDAVNFIVDQTELTTIFCSNEYIDRILAMKAKNMLASVVNIVTFDGSISTDMSTKAKTSLVNIYTWEELIKEGSKADEATYPFEKAEKDDCYIFSYTSGTTGDSKGVKLTHYNIISSVEAVIDRGTRADAETRVISYLPYPHSFE